MREGDGLARAGAAEDVAAIPAVVLSICEGKCGSTSHANVGINPLWRLRVHGLAESCVAAWRAKTTYGAAVKHTARNVDFWWKSETFLLQSPVYLIDVAQVAAAVCGSCPCLNKLQHLVLDRFIRGHSDGGLQQRGQIVHKLPRGDLGDEVRTAVLDAGVGELHHS